MANIPGTNVPAISFGPLGFLAPAEQDILTGVGIDNQVIFGGNLNPGLNTPQGQMASTDTAIIGNANATFVYYTNQVDPAFAQGRMQDAIARIYFLYRKPAQSTVVSCTCNGLPGVTIPVGAIARAQDGNLYTCVSGGTIDVTGNVTLDFACTLTGPIACPAGQLDDIYQAITGWDSITNPADGVLGTNVETRAAFELRRQESVASNARGIIQAIQGQVLQVPGVLDAFAYQNDTGGPITYRGVTLIAHSIYVSVVGGIDAAVAKAIWQKKSPGCSYNGNTTVTVEDDNPAYAIPLPSYEISFERPNALTIPFVVQIANSPSVPADATVQIQNAIIAAFAGADGGARARIASIIYASRYICPVGALGVWAQVVSLQIGSSPGDTVTVDADQVPVTSAVDIAVTYV